MAPLLTEAGYMMRDDEMIGEVIEGALIAWMAAWRATLVRM